MEHVHRPHRAHRRAERVQVDPAPVVGVGVEAQAVGHTWCLSWNCSIASGLRRETEVARPRGALGFLALRRGEGGGGEFVETSDNLLHPREKENLGSKIAAIQNASKMLGTFCTGFSHSPRGSFQARWILYHVARTNRLIATTETIYEKLLTIVDSGYPPFTVYELNKIMREVWFVTDTVIRPSIEQMDTDLVVLLALAAVDDHASTPKDDDNGGSDSCNGTANEEGINGADGT
ncbi:hypothetical protein E2562_003519 [Oryza meyeriana var. granulata]|uniref:Uncharacterized protein n=1 Tax=Oryza meyeriana var. granulata TaxID=110450 RepID=A0A6G1CN85_9ORYZ|nr:hypothetical protein E2562_003519 [Oryza meyeriana var. granulata]